MSRLLIDKFDTQFVPGNSQIRCLAHIVNLVVQKILATIDEAEDPESNDYFDKSVPIHYSPDEDADQLELEKEGEHDKETDKEVNEMEAEEESERFFIQQLTQGGENLSPVKKV